MTPGWHSVYGTRLIAGREFTAADREGASEGGDREPGLRQEVPALRGPPWARWCSSRTGRGSRAAAARLEIVGVVEDAAYRNLRDPMPPTVYLPHGAACRRTTCFPTAPSAFAPRPARRRCSIRALSEALSAVDPDVSLSFRPLKDQVDARLVRERVLALLGGFFGALALLLAGVGPVRRDVVRGDPAARRDWRAHGPWRRRVARPASRAGAGRVAGGLRRRHRHRPQPLAREVRELAAVRPRGSRRGDAGRGRRDDGRRRDAGGVPARVARRANRSGRGAHGRASAPPQLPRSGASVVPRAIRALDRTRRPPRW